MGVWILMARMVPAIGFVIPFYSLFRRLGLNDSYFTISLIYLTIVLPFTAWLMMGFIKGIPEQIEEAAMMDGCSRAQTLVRVIVPVCGPGIATSAIFAFMLSWNEFFYAMIMTGRNTKVVSVVIQGFITTTGMGTPVCSCNADCFSNYFVHRLCAKSAGARADQRCGKGVTRHFSGENVGKKIQTRRVLLCAERSCRSSWLPWL